MHHGDETPEQYDQRMRADGFTPFEVPWQSEPVYSRVTPPADPRTYKIAPAQPISVGPVGHDGTGDRTGIVSLGAMTFTPGPVSRTHSRTPSDAYLVPPVPEGMRPVLPGMAAALYDLEVADIELAVLSDQMTTSRWTLDVTGDDGVVTTELWRPFGKEPADVMVHIPAELRAEAYEKWTARNRAAAAARADKAQAARARRRYLR